MALADPRLVYRVRRRRRAASPTRGYSLIELMVVVVMIAVLAVLAAPTMAEGRAERAVYDSAAEVMMLLRNARGYATQHGTAVTVTVRGDSVTRGTALMNAARRREVAGAPLLPVPSCTQADWNPISAGGNAYGISSSLLQTPDEPDWRVVQDDSTRDNFDIRITGSGGGLGMRLFVGSPSPGTTVTAEQIAVCFTPSGSVFAVAQAGGAVPAFPITSRLTGFVEIDYRRRMVTGFNGLARSVVVPPSGIARLRTL